jgi:hypothetical protein
LFGSRIGQQFLLVLGSTPYALPQRIVAFQQAIADMGMFELLFVHAVTASLSNRLALLPGISAAPIEKPPSQECEKGLVLREAGRSFEERPPVASV